MIDNIFEIQYQRWLKNTNKLRNSIPHIIHHIWLGSELPDKYTPFIDSFKKLNPDFEFILWDEKKILSIPGFRFEKEFKRTSNYGTKSDIARYEILRVYGGFYFDTDFECIKPLDEIADKSSFIAGLQFSDRPEFGNAMIASIPNHFLINKICSQLKPTSTTDIMEIINTTGPGFLTKIFKENLLNLDETVAFVPSEYFYAVPNFEASNIIEVKQKYITEKTYGIHYWDQSWFQNDIYYRICRKLKRFFNKLF